MTTLIEKLKVEEQEALEHLKKAENWVATVRHNISLATKNIITEAEELIGFKPKDVVKPVETVDATASKAVK